MRRAARAHSRHFSASSSASSSSSPPSSQDKNLVLYTADRGARFKALSAFSFLQVGWWGSQAGLDIVSLFQGTSTLGVGGTEIYALAPELVLCGAGGSMAFLALVKFYASKLVGRVELAPLHDKVTISTHTMFGSPAPRTFPVAGIERSPHPSTTYYLFKVENDKWFTMIDRDIGTFWNEPKLVRLLDGRLTRLAQNIRSSSGSGDGDMAGEEQQPQAGEMVTSSGDGQEAAEQATAKRTHQNRMRKRKKQMRQRNRGNA